ncbi:MAG TPA: HEAT repeat domain-containing protein [Chryseolinea sp.]|nr:HEAT repeat domain-containing protein [Chryseolinea sp.]
MEKEKIEAMLIDYIDGKLAGEEKRIVEEQLLKDENTVTLYDQLKEVIQAMESSAGIEPSAALKLNFDRLLGAEIRQEKKGKTIVFQPWFYRIAAAIAFVILGGGIGFWISYQQRQAAALEAMRKEVQATKQLMMAMLDNQHSASQRVLGATVAYNEIEKADPEIVSALISAMNEDENTNVRMAALEALGKFRAQPHVRKALIASLKTQKDPVVQIALIRLMVEMNAPGIRPELERITTDDETLPAVKDEAHAGLLKLS